MPGAFGSSLGAAFGSSFAFPVPGVARVGDSGSHGGTLSTGSPTTRADGGRPVCRVGDTYSCPIHGPNPISSGSSIWRDNGAMLAREGDSTACGAVITSGSSTWRSG